MCATIVPRVCHDCATSVPRCCHDCATVGLHAIYRGIHVADVCHDCATIVPRLCHATVWVCRVWATVGPLSPTAGLGSVCLGRFRSQAGGAGQRDRGGPPPCGAACLRRVTLSPLRPRSGVRVPCRTACAATGRVPLVRGLQPPLAASLGDSGRLRLGPQEQHAKQAALRD